MCVFRTPSMSISKGMVNPTEAELGHYRGTSLIRNSALLESYSSTMHRALWWPYGRLLFLVSEVPLYAFLLACMWSTLERIANSRIKPLYRGTSLIRNLNPPRITIGP